MKSTIDMQYKARKARFVQKYKTWYSVNDVEEREHIVSVHGIFQYAETYLDGSMEAEPLAIIELEDGRIFEVTPASLTFIKEEGEEDEVQNCH